MNCNDVTLVLSMYQDDELDAARKAAVQAHLKECEQCRLELDQLETVNLRVKKLRDVQPAQNFTALVMSKVREREKRRWFALPSLVYSVIFTIFFILGLLITANLKNGTAMTPDDEIYADSILIDSQDLSLINVQDNTFAMLYNGGKKHGK